MSWRSLFWREGTKILVEDLKMSSARHKEDNDAVSTTGAFSYHLVSALSCVSSRRRSKYYKSSQEKLPSYTVLRKRSRVADRDQGLSLPRIS